jgi:hypothetical protein
MFTTVVLALAVGAPVPQPAAPVPTGVAPKLMELKADADGKVLVTVRRTEKAPVVGNAAPVIARDRVVSRSVELNDVKDLSITTADGKKLTTEDAIKQIGKGAIVVVSSDGKPVSPTYLKVFKDDTIVLTSPELAGPSRSGIPQPKALPLPIPPGGIQIQPGKIQVLPIQGGAGGVIQIQVTPAVVPAGKEPPKKDK